MAKGAPDWVLPVQVAVQISGEEIIIRPISTTTSTTAQKSVSTTAYKIASANPDRISIIITNDSTVKCYIGFTNAVTVGTGFPLDEGQIYSSDVYKGNIYAITTSGIATLAIIEDVR